jgi:hypothetical protein
MNKQTAITLSKVASLLIILLAVFSLSAAQTQKHTLIVNGASTQVPVIYINSQAYVGLEALAKVLQGSISSSGPMVALSLPTQPAVQAVASASPPVAPESAPTHPVATTPSFSRDFLNAGIELMSTVREWHTALQTSIENGIPLSAGLLQPYRAQVTTNLRRASVAVTTDADRSAFQLLNNVYMNMGKLSDKYVEMRARLSFIAPDALHNDELNGRIVNCGHFLASAAASGQFSDDGSCH